MKIFFSLPDSTGLVVQDRQIIRFRGRDYQTIRIILLINLLIALLLDLTIEKLVYIKPFYPLLIMGIIFSYDRYFILAFNDKKWKIKEYLSWWINLLWKTHILKNTFHLEITQYSYNPDSIVKLAFYNEDQLITKIKTSLRTSAEVREFVELSKREVKINKKGKSNIS